MSKSVIGDPMLSNASKIFRSLRLWTSSDSRATSQLGLSSPRKMKLRSAHWIYRPSKPANEVSAQRCRPREGVVGDEGKEGDGSARGSRHLQEAAAHGKV
ncbi:hypothetical protein TorRG33x02_304830 [Trema orientale]|uniref:Uncharacterized protein n=1 Tax=Trema orientale TaxID=63057 RepID=A0A2P5BXV6_TREOI|nr:hypothetical protein TorRG33x02_304830 [Trema orientale]